MADRVPSHLSDALLTLLILQGLLNDDQLREFGWRIGFAIGGVAAVVVFWLRRSMDESLSENVIEAARSGEDPVAGSLRELFTTYWRPLLLCFLITLGGTVAFYTYSVNAPAIVKTAPRATSAWAGSEGCVITHGASVPKIALYLFSPSLA